MGLAANVMVHCCCVQNLFDHYNSGGFSCLNSFISLNTSRVRACLLNVISVGGCVKYQACSQAQAHHKALCCALCSSPQLQKLAPTPSSSLFTAYVGTLHTIYVVPSRPVWDTRMTARLYHAPFTSAPLHAHL